VTREHLLPDVDPVNQLGRIPTAVPQVAHIAKQTPIDHVELKGRNDGKPSGYRVVLDRLRASDLESLARKICNEECVWLQHVIRGVRVPEICEARWRIYWHLVNVMHLKHCDIASIFGVHRNTVARAIAHHERRMARAAAARAAFLERRAV
jgi:hypothetical protein